MERCAFIVRGGNMVKIALWYERETLEKMLSGGMEKKSA